MFDKYQKKKEREISKAVQENTKTIFPDFNDIRCTFSIRRVKHHYQNLFIDIVRLTHISCEDKDREIKKYIDRLINR